MSDRKLTFSIDVEDGPDVQVVALTGEADMTAVPYLEEALRIASGKASVVIVDLSAATFIDSPTIGVLVAWTERMQAADGRLTLVCTSPDMLRIFRQIGLDGVLHIVESRPAPAPE
jgi:anti-anti-sigma factor